MRIAASVEIDRSASQVWAYVADYGNDTSWRAGVTQMRPSQPGPAQEGITIHELLRLLGMSFRTDAAIDRVEPRTPAPMARPRPAKAAARLSAGGAERPGQLPVHRGSGGPPARPVSTPGAGGGLAALAAGQRDAVQAQA